MSTVNWGVFGYVALVVAGVGLFLAATLIGAAMAVTRLPFRPRYLFRRNREREWLQLAASVERGEKQAVNACEEYQRIVGCLYLRDGSEDIDTIFAAARRYHVRHFGRLGA